MKIIFDTDGTLTNYNKYVQKRFCKFSLHGKFRNGAKEFIKTCRKNGHHIEIHTSRTISIQKSFIGTICKTFTYFQYCLNGIKLPYKSFYFYENDDKKIIGVINSNPDIVFDDNPYIISELNKQTIKVICINGTHNKNLKENVYMKKINGFEKYEIEDTFNVLFGKTNYQTLNRISKSDLAYKKARLLFPLVFAVFRPIILHKENLMINNNCGVIIAPNHRNTFDPIIITSIFDQNIHWAALKRFFDEKDSIFNNSKNPLLCKITAKGFKRLEYFPIERLKDNLKANNLKSTKDMQKFLKNHQYVGIFPEGTTRKPENSDFGLFDPTFISLAKRNDALIQPVTVLWIKELKISQKLIVNIGKPFKASELSKEETYNKYISIQNKQLNENKKVRNSLRKQRQKQLCQSKID